MACALFLGIVVNFLVNIKKNDNIVDEKNDGVEE